MYAARRRRMTLACVLLANAVAGGAAYGQAQQDVRTTKEYCLKVAPGKGAEYEAFLRDVTVPLNQSRADAGELEWWGLERAVLPAGSSARCDLIQAYTYKGFPPEETTNAQLDAALKRAGLKWTAEEVLARRSHLVQLASLGFWYSIDAVGPAAPKGAYMVFNHHKVKRDGYDEYVRLERTWKTLVEAWLKAGGKGSWVLTGLWMPAGESVPFNAMTIDIHPDWDALMKGVPVMDLWPKVHPDTPFAQVEVEKDKVRTLHDQEIFQLVESVVRTAAR